MELKELIEKCHQTAKNKGFWDNKERNIAEMLMLINSELCEALEIHRKEGIIRKNYDNIKNLSDDNEFKTHFERHLKDSFTDEICDTFIRLFDMCGGLNLDIEKHIELKMRYNETRERLHGKKY